MQEMETTPKMIKDKADKLAWLTKLINTVGIFWGQTLTVKPSKVVAGLEADQTNMLLQAIALGASSGPKLVQRSSPLPSTARCPQLAAAEGVQRPTETARHARENEGRSASPKRQAAPAAEPRPSRSSNKDESKPRSPRARRETATVGTPIDGETATAKAQGECYREKDQGCLCQTSAGYYD